MEAGGEWEAGAAVPSSNPSEGGNLQRHIKKRALKNKALSVGFNEKDLKDFVTGFHKRKKKRRKIARRQLEEKERAKRIEIRRKRKLERETAMNPGASPEEESDKKDSGPGGEDDDLEQDELDRTQSVSGTKMYENSVLTITVRTSELAGEEDEVGPRESQSQGQRQRLNGESSKRGILPPMKKPMKRKGGSQRSSGKKKRGKSESKTKKRAKKSRKR